MPKRVILPPHLSAAPFHISEAEELGITASRLRGTDLRTPFRGVRASASAPVDRISAYAKRMPPHFYFSHATAGGLWEIMRPATSVLLVTVPFPYRAPKGIGVHGHQAPTGATVVTRHDGLRVSTAADTWRALATTLTLDELVIAADALTRRKRPITTTEELAEATLLQARGRGARRAAAALALARAGTDSPKETVWRLLMVRAGLPKPVVNFPILNEHGAFVAFGDLAYPEYNVLVEYDGGQHREDEKQFNRDIDRLDDVMELDWRVIRVNKSHVDSRSASRLAKIRTALIERGWQPPTVPKR